MKRATRRPALLRYKRGKPRPRRCPPGDASAGVAPLLPGGKEGSSRFYRLIEVGRASAADGHSPANSWYEAVDATAFSASAVATLTLLAYTICVW